SVSPISPNTMATSAPPVNQGGHVHRNRAYNYIGTRKRCGACSLRSQCTSAAFRSLIIHQHEPARQRARELVSTEAFAKAQRQRKKVEALFAELKNQIGLRRLAHVESNSFGSSSSWQRRRRTSSDWCGFSLRRHHLVWQPPLGDTIRELAASRPTGREITPTTDFFNTHACLRQLRAV